MKLIKRYPDCNIFYSLIKKKYILEAIDDLQHFNSLEECEMYIINKMHNKLEEKQDRIETRIVELGEAVNLKRVGSA